MPQQIRARLLLALKLALSGLLLWYVLTKVDARGIVTRLQDTQARWLLPSLLLGPLAVILSAMRWRLLSLGLLGFGEAVRYTWIGLFFGSIMPGIIGGDVAKGVSLAAKQARARDSRLPVSIIVDKLVGFWVLLLGFNLVALAVLISQPQLLAGMRQVLWATAAATAVGLGGAAAICHPRGASRVGALADWIPVAWLRSGVHRVLSAVASYSGQGRALRLAALLSGVIHALNVLLIWLVMHSLAIPGTLWFAAVFYSLLSVLLALPVSVSGVGVRDAFAASMFAAFGLSPESGVAFSWLLLGLSIPNALIGGCIQLWEMFHRDSPD